MQWLMKAVGALAMCTTLVLSCSDDADQTATPGVSGAGAGGRAGGRAGEGGAINGEGGVTEGGAAGSPMAAGAAGEALGGAGNDSGGGSSIGGGGTGGRGGSAGGNAGGQSNMPNQTGSSTGQFTGCPSTGTCTKCEGQKAAGVGNCMVVNGQYSMNIAADCGDEKGIGINLNGGVPPTAGATYTVAGALDTGAGKASISRTTGVSGTLEFGTSGTITVLPGMPITAQFTVVAFPSGFTAEGEIICY